MGTSLGGIPPENNETEKGSFLLWAFLVILVVLNIYLLTLAYAKFVGAE